MALATLGIDDEIITLFSKSILDSKTKITRCIKCNNLSEGDYCSICLDKTRDISTICLVEEPRNVIALEKVGTYHGLYHVLNGLISPLDGIGPEDININSLLKRIEDEKIKEIIIAIKPSIEGETTSLYILKKLEKTDVIVSKIAYGIPIGADIDYLELALDDRKRISNSK